MERKQVTCGNCGGTGYINIYENVSGTTSGTISLRIKEATVCNNCNGKGYTEYAVFSIEEAEAILKHCGLSTES